MRKLLIFTVYLLLFSSIASVEVSASTKGYEINSMKELLTEAKKIRDNQSKNGVQSLNATGISKEEQILIENTDPAVLEVYRSTLEKELQEFSIPEVTSSVRNSEEKTFELPNSGAKITVTTESVSVEEDPIEDKAIEGITPFALVNVKFGARDYIIKYKITAYLYPDSICGLVTSYTAKKDGLRVTSSSKAGTLSIFPTQISASAKTTDARAEKIGYDINAQGDYKVTIGGYKGIGLVSFDMTITSTVRWDASTSTSLHVTEKYSQIGDKTKK